MRGMMDGTSDLTSSHRSPWLLDPEPDGNRPSLVSQSLLRSSSVSSRVLNIEFVKVLEGLRLQGASRCDSCPGNG